MHVISSTLKQPPPSEINKIQVWTERGQGQQRQLCASITIPYSVTAVWQVLTAYEQMPDFIPNLIKTQHIPHPNGGIRIEQTGYCQLWQVRVSARVVLDMTEHFPHHIHFEMVEGDFQQFSGYCQLETLMNADREETRLHYSVRVVPKITMPVLLLERQLRHDLPINLMAIRQRVEQLFT